MKKLISAILSFALMCSFVCPALASNAVIDTEFIGNVQHPNCTWPAEMYIFDETADKEAYEMLLNSDLITDNVKRIIQGENFIVGDGVKLSPELSDIYSGIDPLWLSGGTNYTHQYITSTALSILAKDKNISQFKTYSDTILMGSDKPDEDETSEAFAGHFYNPYTGKNYLGNANNTALTNFSKHYSTAVSQYKSRSYNSAFDELGRALHYLQDVSEPHHASNLIAVITNHGDFEEYANENRTKYSTYTLPASSYDYALNTDYRDMLANCAYFAYDYKEQCQNTSSYATTLSATLKQAQRNSAAILWKFANDAGIV